MKTYMFGKFFYRQDAKIIKCGRSGDSIGTLPLNWTQECWGWVISWCPSYNSSIVQKQGPWAAWRWWCSMCVWMCLWACLYVSVCRPLLWQTEEPDLSELERSLHNYFSSRFNFLPARITCLYTYNQRSTIRPLAIPTRSLFVMSPDVLIAGTAMPFFIRRKPGVVPMERKS